MNLLDLQAAVIDGNAKASEALTRTALAAGMAPMRVIFDALVPAMHEVGERFKRDEYYVPEMLLAARALKASLGLLKPLLVGPDAPSGPPVAIGTVQGDIHDIGKNLVGTMLEGAGFKVIDLGANVAPERFVQAVAEQGAEVIGMSALLTTTMTNMPATVEALRQAGLRDRVVVVVGGAPVTAAFAEQIGADGFAPEAASAVEVIKGLLSQRVAAAR